MEKIIVSIAILSFASAACAVSLPPTQENIKKADATPSDAKNFVKAPSTQPTDTKPGDVVIFVVDGVQYQYGSSLSPAEAYNLYANGGGGGE